MRFHDLLALVAIAGGRQPNVQQMARIYREVRRKEAAILKESGAKLSLLAVNFHSSPNKPLTPPPLATGMILATQLRYTTQFPEGLPN